MTNDTDKKVVSLASTKQGDPEFAATLRNIAERFKKGEITDIVVITYDRVTYDYRTYGNWQDRWHMIGAIENAKMRTMFSD
jgi:hypothetical protein